MSKHVPVLLNEIIQYLDPKPGEHFIDCTLGGGGHAEAILKMTAPDGKILAMDIDIKAIEEAKLFLSKYLERIIFVNDNFRNLLSVYEQNFSFPVSGIVLDLGLSSRQLGDKSYGISFAKDGPLIMRLDGRDCGLTAEEIINKWPKKKLERIILEYGDERNVKCIVEAIIKFRKKKRISSTVQLANIIEQCFNRRALSSKPRPSQRAGHGGKRIHPATKTFQALRIAVNDEKESLCEVLPQAIDILAQNGRLAVISFHSLEDRIVKRFFQDAGSGKHPKVKVLTNGIIKPSRSEILENPRSRSAKLRVVEKL